MASKNELRDGRDANGRFAAGNPGGPGRPRRAVERDYLITLASCCTPEVWQEICQAAVQLARDGDARAREWQTRYVMGESSLLSLAADESVGHSVDAVIQQRAEERSHDRAELRKLRELAEETEVDEDFFDDEDDKQGQGDDPSIDRLGFLSQL